MPVCPLIDDNESLPIKSVTDTEKAYRERFNAFKVDSINGKMSQVEINEKIQAFKNNYTIWVAHYGASKPSYSGQYGIWQYSGNGNCTGIQSEVDLNYGYIDYADIIKNSGLNGFCKSSPAPIEKPKKKVKIQIDGHSYEGEVTENG